MALTPSKMAELGMQAPFFSLPDFTGKTVSLDDFKGKDALLVMFICNHCPYVKHVAKALALLAKDYQAKNAGIIGINSNDIDNYPEDSPDNMKKMAEKNGWIFPYLFDEAQAVAKAYSAACTPDFFLFDKDLRLAYRGQLDDSRPENSLPVTGKDLRLAIDAVLGNKPVPSDQKPSIGCNIKWKRSS